MTTDQSKKQTATDKAGTYTSTGFQPTKKQQPKKSISILDILLGRK